jgi:hypothetical protein
MLAGPAPRRGDAVAPAQAHAAAPSMVHRPASQGARPAARRCEGLASTPLPGRFGSAGAAATAQRGARRQRQAAVRGSRPPGGVCHG